MNPRVASVAPEKMGLLRVTFTNGEVRRFDATPYLAYPVFERLRDPAFFSLVQADHGTVAWPDGTDLCPDTVYLESEPIH